MLQTRSSLALLTAAVLVATASFGGCTTTETPPPAATDGTDSGSTTSGDPNEPVPNIDDTQTPPDPDEALAPEVTAISPDKAVVGGVGPSLVVSGNNFVPRSIVQLDGAPLSTTFISAKELRATIPSGKLSVVGTLRVSVGTSPPGGGASKEVVFSVENPHPELTKLTPLSVLAGAGATSLDVSGASFVSGSKIVFGGTELTTTFNSSTSLHATIPSDLLVSSGAVPVTVVSPDPGGGPSSPISFTVANPGAAVSNINPSAAFVGSAAFDMTVVGSGFVNGSTVLFNGNALTTTYQSDTTLKASVPATSLTAASDGFPIAVSNPPPGGGVSSPVAFKVLYPQPTLSSASPSSVAAGSGPTDITVTGVGFFVTSQITFNDAPAVTKFVDGTHLKATADASLLASASTILVRVVNSTPGGGTSSAVALMVANGVPTITSFSPSSVVAGSPAKLITIRGTGFVSGSSVTSNGQSIASTYVSGSSLTATIPANHLINFGSVTINVTNPSPGGGKSADAFLPVGCDTTGVNYALSSLNSTVTVNTNFDGTNMMSRFNAAASCATVVYASTTQPGRYTIVQNNSGSSATLAAWADCTGVTQGDAFLAFYKRPTIPANDQERLGCATSVSEGTNGGGLSSPDSNGSLWCPGFTKANGGGLTLGVCEKAVIHIQPFDYQSTSYKAPTRLRFELE
jgi:hypothetical protein